MGSSKNEFVHIQRSEVQTEGTMARRGAWRALLAALVLLAPVADVADPRAGAGGGRHAAAGVAPREFGQHRWLMTVSSVHNFPVVCCLYGQQLMNYMEAAWLAGSVLGRGLVEPSFIHQACASPSRTRASCADARTYARALRVRAHAPVSIHVQTRACACKHTQARDDAVYERLKGQGKLNSVNFTAILGTIPVPGSRLFDLWAWADNNEDSRIKVQAFATNTTFWAATGGTIDLLIVCDAMVIGGQACADFDRCSQRHCQTLPSDPGPFPRRMEFFGRMHLVKRVVCLPYTEVQLRGQIDAAAQASGDTVVALALHNRQINAIAGGSMQGLLFPIASFGSKAYTGQELWSLDKRLSEDWLSILARFTPSPQVLYYTRARARAHAHTHRGLALHPRSLDALAAGCMYDMYMWMCMCMYMYM